MLLLKCCARVLACLTTFQSLRRATVSGKSFRLQHMGKSDLPCLYCPVAPFGRLGLEFLCLFQCAAWCFIRTMSGFVKDSSFILYFFKLYTSIPHCLPLRFLLWFAWLGFSWHAETCFASQELLPRLRMVFVLVVVVTVSSYALGL